MKFLYKIRLIRKLQLLTYRFSLKNIRNRKELPHILNSRKLLGEGAEIGVHRGIFSELILKKWKGEKLYSVDQWLRRGQKPVHPFWNPTQEVWEDYYNETLDKLYKFGDRSKVIRLSSKEATKNFNDNQLDFVYIDAAHHYEAINEDIHLWYPKVRPGGILCGHDYRNGLGPQSKVFYGVKKAVDEFVVRNNLQLYKSKEIGFPSWFIIKPKYNR